MLVFKFYLFILEFSIKKKFSPNSSFLMSLYINELFLFNVFQPIAIIIIFNGQIVSKMIWCIPLQIGPHILLISLLL